MHRAVRASELARCVRQRAGSWSATPASRGSLGRERNPGEWRAPAERPRLPAWVRRCREEPAPQGSRPSHCPDIACADFECEPVLQPTVRAAPIAQPSCIPEDLGLTDPLEPPAREVSKPAPEAASEFQTGSKLNGPGC